MCSGLSSDGIDIIGCTLNLQALLAASGSPLSLKYSYNLMYTVPYVLIMPNMMLLQRNALIITHQARAPPSGGSTDEADSFI